MKTFFIALIFFIVPSHFFSQDDKKEAELEKGLADLKSDSAKIIRMLEYADGKESSTESAVKYSKKAFDLAFKNKFSRLSVEACEIVGDAYWYGSNYATANEYYFKELKMSDSLGLIKNKARAYYNIGWIKCLQLESFKDRNYLFKALHIFEKLHDTVNFYNAVSAIASTYKDMSAREPKYLDSALFYYKNLVYYTEHKKGLAYNVPIHSHYAYFLTQIGRYKEAKMYLLKCCQEAKSQKQNANYMISRVHLANLYLKMDSIEVAKKIFDEELPVAKKLNYDDQVMKIYELRGEIYQREKKYKEALEYHILFKELSDLAVKKIFKSDLKEKEADYEIGKREGNIKKLEDINELAELKNKQNRYVIFGLIFIGFLIILIAFNLFRNNKAKQKANQLLNEKNKLIEEQKKFVEEKNTDITNSINYAKRIQEAVLPAKELKYRIFPDAFVLFQPKDIVSGDFYWFAEKNNKRIISAVDCTGHGVPGAFMSMIGNTFLAETVNERGITEPGLILNELRNKVISSLKQSDVANSTKDGMDMSLLCFNEKNTVVEFAGANNPLWLIRSGECIEYKGDKMPIGYFQGKGDLFTNIKIDLQKGDTLYIFTDGYADQFGGAGGKKLKYKQLKEILLSVQKLSMQEQEVVLQKKFHDWKGKLEQVDDICIIGVRV